MRPKDLAEAARVDAALTTFHHAEHQLPGIQNLACRTVFLEQLFESIHRVQYVTRGVLGRQLDPQRADPCSDLFDPIKGAAVRAQQGDPDEACWLVFLSVHFGKHRQHGWQYARDVYGGLGSMVRWDWPRMSANPEAFRQWLAANQTTLRQKGFGRIFGNHRKYQGIDAHKPNGTGAAFVSYVKWLNPPRTHTGLVQDAVRDVGNDSQALFSHLYESMNAVASFGRTAKFDYLTMLGKLGLAPITPGSPYLKDATGPLMGAKLLFLGSTDATGISTNQLDAWVVRLGAATQVGMQELEDSLCNWQKSPATLVRFRG
jgi:hypothetical protein